MDSGVQFRQLSLLRGETQVSATPQVGARTTLHHVGVTAAAHRYNFAYMVPAAVPIVLHLHALTYFKGWQSEGVLSEAHIILRELTLAASDG